MKYCLSCGAQLFQGGLHIAHGKDQVVWTDGIHSVRDVVDCYGPFASCPPPELPADWEKHVTPPSPEELVQIDQNAMELAFDLELS